MRSATMIGCAGIAALTCAGSAAAALPSPPEPPLLPPLPSLPAPLPQPPVELPPVSPAPLPVPPSPALPVAPRVVPPATAPNAGLAAQPPAATDPGTTERPPFAAAAGSTATRPHETIRPGKVRQTGRTVAIGYVLARSGRVFVILRGPVPRCSVVSRFSVLGERGSNALQFDGTVGRERLESGTYLIGLRTAGSNVRWKLLAVSDDAVRPVRRGAATVVRACAESSALGMLVSSEISGDPTAHAYAASRPAVDPGSPGGGLRPSVLPFVGVEEAIGQLPAAAGILMLLLLLGSLAGITAFVVRVLRAS